MTAFYYKAVVFLILELLFFFHLQLENGPLGVLAGLTFFMPQLISAYITLRWKYSHWRWDSSVNLPWAVALSTLSYTMVYAVMTIINVGYLNLNLITSDIDLVYNGVVMITLLALNSAFFKVAKCM